MKYLKLFEDYILEGFSNEQIIKLDIQHRFERFQNGLNYICGYQSQNPIKGESNVLKSFFKYVNEQCLYWNKHREVVLKIIKNIVGDDGVKKNPKYYHSIKDIFGEIKVKDALFNVFNSTPPRDPQDPRSKKLEECDFVHPINDTKEDLEKVIYYLKKIVEWDNKEKPSNMSEPRQTSLYVDYPEYADIFQPYPKINPSRNWSDSPSNFGSNKYQSFRSKTDDSDLEEIIRRLEKLLKIFKDSNYINYLKEFIYTTTYSKPGGYMTLCFY